MRVVFLSHNYPRDHSDVAGAFLHPLAVALTARGVEVRVVTPSDRGAGGHSELNGVAVHRVRYASPNREIYAHSGAMASAVKTPAGLLALRRMIGSLREAALQAAQGADRVVVHAHWWIPAGMAAPSNLPLVVTCHGSDVRLLDSSLPGRWLGGRVLRRANVVTTVSSPLAATITERTGAMVARDAIQPMPLADIERPVSTGGEGVIMVGRLTRQKRVDLALRAFHQACRQGLDCQLTIVGDGPERDALESLARTLGIQSVVRFIGSVAPAQIPGFLASSDAMLMTASAEGLGLAAVEAMVQGVPVIACTDGGGLTDVVPAARGGRIVAPESGAIASALKELTANLELERAGALDHGFEWQSRLAPEAVAERCLTWYQRALDA